MKAFLLAACAVVGLCVVSGCDRVGPEDTASSPKAASISGEATAEPYPLLHAEERTRASMEEGRRVDCNPDPDGPVADPPGPGTIYLAGAIKAGDWKRVAEELNDQDGVPPGLSAADRRRLERIRLSLRMTDPARRGDAEAVRALLKAGADPDFEVGRGAGPMYWAAYCDRVEVLKALIAAGADVDRRFLWEAGRAEYRSTPLMVAVFRGAPGAVRVLLEAGANPNLYEEVRAVGEAGGPWDRRAYGVLSMSTTNEIVRLLLNGGADPNLSSSGWTPLMAAASERDPEKARMLLAHGADPDARNSEGETAAMIAEKAGAPEVLDVLRPKAKG